VDFHPLPLRLLPKVGTQAPSAVLGDGKLSFRRKECEKFTNIGCAVDA